MQTRDRQWRVEAVRPGERDYFRLIHGDNIVDGLVIASLQRLLAEAGVDMADLVEADTTPMSGAAGAA
ncbi:hypothetical protein [Actinoplanes auranticolor]|nr:hypothetical protein [Actinoplanes auranticolor]